MMVRADNAEELAPIAQEIGAEVIRGPVRYLGTCVKKVTQ